MGIDLIARIIWYILIFINIYWLGYIVGEQKILKDLLKEDLERVKDIEYSRITKTNNR